MDTKCCICSRCTYVKTCKSPCAPVELYINQDNDEDVWAGVSFVEGRIERFASKKRETVSTTEAILQNYFLDRMQPTQIAESHYKSRQYVYYVIRKYSKLIAENIRKTVRKG